MTSPVRGRAARHLTAENRPQPEKSNEGTNRTDWYSERAIHNLSAQSRRRPTTGKASPQQRDLAPSAARKLPQPILRSCCVFCGRVDGVSQSEHNGPMVMPEPRLDTTMHGSGEHKAFRHIGKRSARNRAPRPCAQREVQAPTPPQEVTRPRIRKTRIIVRAMVPSALKANTVCDAPRRGNANKRGLRPVATGAHDAPEETHRMCTTIVSLQAMRRCYTN